jgi:hypothetical protein
MVRTAASRSPRRGDPIPQSGLRFPKHRSNARPQSMTTAEPTSCLAGHGTPLRLHQMAFHSATASSSSRRLISFTSSSAYSVKDHANSDCLIGCICFTCRSRCGPELVHPSTLNAANHFRPQFLQHFADCGPGSPLVRSVPRVLLIR